MIRKVTLRTQIISGNRESYYLDYFPAVEHPITGEKTRREFLNLYRFCDYAIEEVTYYDQKKIKRTRYYPIEITKKNRNGQSEKKKKPKKLSLLQKQHNKSVEILAEQIRQKREYETNRPEVYNEYDREQIRLKELGNKSFIRYFEKQADTKNERNREVWLSSIAYFKAFVKRDIQFKDLNKELCDDFRNYLLTTKGLKIKSRQLGRNSAHSYFSRLRATLKQAFREGYFISDLGGRLQSITAEKKIRTRLTIEDLNKLARTECGNPLLKRASLFSALTGLRFSDVQNLKWKDLEYEKDFGFRISLIIQKTGDTLILPISDQAASLAGESKDPEVKIFEGLIYSATENKTLAQWGADAGINKKITWHVMRHSFASLQVAYGTNLQLIQKALGHAHASTTELYAQVESRQLRDAMNLIKLDMDV